MDPGVCIELVYNVKLMRTTYDSLAEMPQVPPVGTVLEPPPPPPPYE